MRGATLHRRSYPNATLPMLSKPITYGSLDGETFGLVESPSRIEAWLARDDAWIGGTTRLVRTRRSGALQGGIRGQVSVAAAVSG
jgi:hypothetical protein